MAQSVVKSNYEIEAAWIRLLPHLGQFNRGDDIADAWLTATSGIDFRRIDSRMRRHYRRIDIWSTRTGDATHLCTHEEQVELRRKKDASALRAHRRSMLVNRSTARGSLSPQLAAESDRALVRTLSHLDSAEKYRREDRVLTGTPEPRPRIG